MTSLPPPPPAEAPAVTRRAILLAGLAGGAAVALPGAAPASPARAVAPATRGDPFTLGVASGEPAPDGMVLWTRLATDPLADDGLGGLGEARTDVEWEIADDEGFRKVVRRGSETTGPDLGHSVHVELAGLAPGREYFYRFRAGTEISPAGRTRTAPPPTAMTPLTMCFTSCSQYEHGFFTAYRRLAEEEPDLVLHLGDYIYEYAAGEYVAPGGNVRDHVGPETETLANYRQRHAQYRTDLDLQAAHAAAPWLVVLDDHEVDNNWADEIPEKPQPDFLARRAAALRGYWENMPLRRRFDDPASPVVGTELVSSSITSGGDGSETRPDTATTLAENPHIRFFNNRRGYVRTRFTADELTADFQVLPYVQRAGAPVQTRASFAVQDRRPGLNPPV
ncbi:MAG: alkaline phosphatase D family protein [Pseudonocardiaceae bacterium]